MQRFSFQDSVGACAAPAKPRLSKSKNWRKDFVNAVRSYRDPSIPSQRVPARPAATADAAPRMRRATTNDAAQVFRHGQEMNHGSVRRPSRDEAIEMKQSPQGTGGTAELVASYPPAHKRNPAGGAYGISETEEGLHLYFYPGTPLDMGTTTANGTGAATIDGKLIRTEDLNPITRDTNAKNRAFWSKQQGGR